MAFGGGIGGSVPGPNWSLQTVWYIDSVNGDDNNRGDSWSRAIQTFEELLDRLGPYRLATDYTVNARGDFDTMPIDYTIADGGYLDIVFEIRSVDFTYTVASYTARNPNVTALWNVIETVEAGAVANMVDARCRFIDGPATGCIFWGALDIAAIGAKKIEVTDPYSFTKANGTWLLGTPVAGNQFVVESLYIVRSFSVNITRVSDQGFNFAIRNAQLGESPGAKLGDAIFKVDGWGSTVGCYWYTAGLQTDGYHVTDGFLSGAVIRGNRGAPVDRARFIGDLFTNDNYLFSDVVIWDSVFTDTTCGVEASEVNFIGGVAFLMNDFTNPITIDNPVYLYSADCRLIINTNGEATGYTYVRGCNTYAFRVPPGSTVNYTVKPLMAFVGVGANYALVGVTARATSANVPYVDASNAGGYAAFIEGMIGTLG